MHRIGIAAPHLASARTTSTRRSGRYRARAARWSATRQTERLVVRGQVQGDQPAGRAGHDRRGQLRDQQVRDARWCTSCPARRSASPPRRSPSAPAGRPAGAGGTIRTASHLPGGDRDLVLPADRGHLAGPVRVAAAHVGLDAQRLRRPSAAPGPRAPTIAAAWSSAATGSPSSSIRPQQHQVADRVPGQRIGSPTGRTGTATAPRSAASTGSSSASAASAWRRSPGGSSAPLGPQPTAGPAVVADRDHRGDVQVEVAGAQRRSARSEAPEPVPAAERDHLEPVARSRSPAVTPAPGRGAGRGRTSRMSRSRAASSSAIATLRCLPPVQPTATVR